MRTNSCLGTVLALALGACLSCGPNNWSDDDGGDAGQRDGGDGAAESDWDACHDGRDNDGDGLADCADDECHWIEECGAGDGGPRPDTDVDFEECDGVVDSSGSMENDARAVQENMDDFAAFIAATGIDFHVVMISDRGFVTPSALFSSDPERFLFIDQDVDSQEVFPRALDQFPLFEDFLRPMALTHIVGVTDDNDDIGADEFVTAMRALLGHDFTFHAIAATAGTWGIPCTRGFVPSAAVGRRYFDAAAATGGLEFSICTNDWSGLFRTLAETVAVTEELPCAFVLPEPPEGMVFDRMQVNVTHTPEGGSTAVLPYAGGAAGCGSTNGWYYDDEESPSQIILCPSACEAVTSGPGAVDITLGCATVII